MAASIEVPRSPVHRLTGKMIAIAAAAAIAGAAGAGAIGFWLGGNFDQPVQQSATVSQDVAGPGAYSTANAKALTEAWWIARLGVRPDTNSLAPSGMFSRGNVHPLKHAGFTGRVGMTTGVESPAAIAGMYSAKNVQALKDAGFTGRLGIETELWPAPGR